MTSIYKLLFVVGMTIFSSIQFAATEARADLIYELVSHPSDQSGHTLSGLITTSDSATNDGILLSSEVLSWQFTIAGPTSTSISSTDAGATLQMNGDVSITAGQITLEQPAIMSGFLHRIEMSHSDGSRVLWHRDEFFGLFTDIYQGFSQNNNSWTSNSPTMSGTDPWLVATRVSSVPEPTSASLFGIVVGVVMVRQRRR